MGMDFRGQVWTRVWKMTFLVWNRVSIGEPGGTPPPRIPRSTPLPLGLHTLAALSSLKKRWFAFIDVVLKGLWHGCPVQFLDNTSCAYLFAMELEELPVKDKITTSCQIPYVQYVSIAWFQTFQTTMNFENLLAYKFSKTTIAICFNLIQVCPSVSPFVFAVVFFLRLTDFEQLCLCVSLNLVAVPSVWILINFVTWLHWSPRCLCYLSSLLRSVNCELCFCFFRAYYKSLGIDLWCGELCGWFYTKGKCSSWPLNKSTEDASLQG